MAGVEREAVATGQIAGELEVNPGVVQWHTPLAAGEAVGSECEDAEGQATDDQQAC